MGWLIGPLIVFVGMGLLLEALEGAVGTVPRVRERWRTDLAWWLFTPLVAKPLGQLATLATLVPAVLALGLPRGDALIAGHGPLATLSWPVQLLGVVVVTDFFGYWMHRLHHRSILWDTHAVHHSSEHLDWLAAVRVHPFNAWMQRAPGLLAVVLLGFDLRVIAAVAPILGLYGVLLHANLKLRLGPVVYLFVTPTFHRWHHAREGAPSNGCNFAGLLPMWDLLFGTFHLPATEPMDFGVHGDAPPESFWGQLTWPARR